MFELLAVALVLQATKKRSVRSGTAPKRVVCENCSRPYAFKIRQTVAAESFYSQKAADNSAEAALRLALAHGLPMMPCPACGWYQADMVADFRKRLKWKG